MGRIMWHTEASKMMSDNDTYAKTQRLHSRLELACCTCFSQATHKATLLSAAINNTLTHLKWQSLQCECMFVFESRLVQHLAGTWRRLQHL